MAKGEVQITGVIQRILNDSDLEHLSVKDLRNFVIHMQDEFVDGGDEEESDEDLEKYVI